MNTLRKAVVIGAASIAAVALAAPAYAATPVKKAGTSTTYSGNVQGALSGTASVTTTLGGGTCNASTLLGTVTSGGALTINTASFTDCGDTTVTAQSLPWTGGSFDNTTAVVGGREGTVTIGGFRVRAVVSVFSITCIYAGTVTADGNNNANLDVTINQSLAKQSGSSFLCPGTANVTAAYTIRGETTANSGTFDQALAL
ncbi:hypothetical protein EDD29_3975 [Actinocorallia herbida]|uniref:Neocarzinostatin family protein n=1 Tax=Actinocorallia herbida TaxID=58109 RepID=A0A3N1CYQ1_9ACTN|nr:hypothetical protein [Actinocorallia herbida]ROO86409.1 hypothetical protein EDD29_3975 [Actinocorallia herbida]